MIFFFWKTFFVAVLLRAFFFFNFFLKNLVSPKGKTDRSLTLLWCLIIYLRLFGLFFYMKVQKLFFSQSCRVIFPPKKMFFSLKTWL